jgi:apolipoprotein N-acyltransferase
MKIKFKLKARSVLLSVSSALIFWIMMTFQLWFLVWICFAPVFASLKKKRALESLFLIFLFILLLNCFSFGWFNKYNLKLILISILLMGSVGFLLVVVSNRLSFNRVLEILSLPLVWGVSTLVLSFHFLNNSWLDISFFQPMSAPLIWYIGSVGMTFFIILVNSLFADYIYYKDKRVLIITLILLIIPISSYLYCNLAEVEGRQVRVALVQGNFNQGWEWRMDNVEYLLDSYERLTREAAKENPDFIVWPEYAIPADIFMRESLHNRISNLAKESNAYLIIGTLTFIEENQTGYYDKRTDTVLVFSPEGKLTGRYDSIKPVPFDTSVMPKDTLSTESKNNFSVIHTEKGSFSLGLCFEEYADIKSFKGESDFIITLVNDQRFDKTLGMELVALFPRLRAVENRKYLVRASNTGVTQVINPYGEVIDRIEKYKEGILVSDIYI